MSVEEDPFRRQGLVAQGFTGFVAFRGIDLSGVPTEPGVYVVLREVDEPPGFRHRNPAGWFKGQDPTVPVTELKAAWPTGAHCVYIGKAAAGTRGKRHLRQRIKEFRRYGDGEPVGHQGGRRIWQLRDSDDFVIGWCCTGIGEDPEEVEGRLIRAFVQRYGMRPIGNRTQGRRA